MKQRVVLFFAVLLVLAFGSVFATAAEKHQRFTGTGAMDVSVRPGSAAGLYTDSPGFEIRIHLSAMASSGTLLVDVASAVSGEYGCNLETYDMSGVLDYARAFDNRIAAEDTIRLRWDNTGGVTWGVEVIWD